MVVDDFVDGTGQLSVLAPDQVVTDTAVGLNGVYNGFRLVVFEDQLVMGGVTLTIGGGQASVRNLPNTQGYVSFEYDVTGLNLGPEASIRVNGNGLSDFDAYFSGAPAGSPWGIYAPDFFEQGGADNSWVSLGNAWFITGSPYQSWSAVQSLRIYQGGVTGTSWDITSIELIPAPVPEPAAFPLIAAMGVGLIALWIRAPVRKPLEPASL